LRAVEVPYAAVMRLRNRLYDGGWLSAFRPPAKVISVGNLTLGGTGKTPMVEWLVRRLSAEGRTVAIISRGYGARHGQPNDEALELAHKLPGVRHLQNPDRVAAARELLAAEPCDIIVLDDAFQHRRIARDLDIVLLDALEPFGFGHVFPRGMLREPLAGLARAQVIVLSRADMIPPARRVAIRAQVERVAPQATWVEACHAPQRLVSATGEEQPLALLAGRRVAAFCGIGNPAGFRHTLETCNCSLVAMQEFPDHHAYGAADLERLTHWAAGLEVSAVLCTEKDLVKMNRDHLGQREVWAVRVGLEFMSGQGELEKRVKEVLGACFAESPSVRTPGRAGG
jgi:tetraacyldisaccharide 4'-kinase